MTYLINNFINAKMGIIVSNGISNIDYGNATINIAKNMVLHIIMNQLMNMCYY